MAETPMQEPVAEVESYTNGSYSRNYKVRWLRDVPKGTKLYAHPASEVEAARASLPAPTEIAPDEITVNLVRLAGLDKHKARECEAIVRQILARAAARHGVDNASPVSDEKESDTALLRQCLEALEGVARWVELRPKQHPYDAWQAVEAAIAAARQALGKP